MAATRHTISLTAKDSADLAELQEYTDAGTVSEAYRIVLRLMHTVARAEQADMRVELKDPSGIKRPEILAVGSIVAG